MEKRKNCWILSTDQPSKLGYISESKTYHLYNNNVFLDELANAINIYITSSEDIKEGDWLIYNNKLYKDSKRSFTGVDYSNCKKIILTTDPDLIADGVQAIDDDFLKWFVKNSSCEFVEVDEETHFEADKSKRANPLNGFYYLHKIIIPQEEPKQEFLLFDKERADTITSEGQKTVRELQNTIQQETLEEAAEKYAIRNFDSSWKDVTDHFISGANYQAERMYSEEDMEKAFQNGLNRSFDSDFDRWFEQFKKK